MHTIVQAYSADAADLPYDCNTLEYARYFKQPQLMHSHRYAKDIVRHDAIKIQSTHLGTSSAARPHPS